MATTPKARTNLGRVEGRSLRPSAVRFYAPLLKDVGVLTASADDLVKALDIKIFKELSTELKK